MFLRKKDRTSLYAGRNIVVRLVIRAIIGFDTLLSKTIPRALLRMGQLPCGWFVPVILVPEAGLLGAVRPGASVILCDCDPGSLRRTRTAAAGSRSVRCGRSGWCGS